MSKKGRKIGFIGLGAMGSRMARNLIDDGFDVIAYDIRKDAVNSLETLGAIPADSPKAVGEKSEIVVLSLPSSSEVIDTVTGQNGVLDGIKRDGIIVDTSTIDPNTTKELEKIAKEKNVKFIDAPVSGGTIGAEKATLSVMVGGKKEVVDSCVDVLNALGENIYHVGDVGSGQVFKLINNMLVGINLAAVGEAMVLASKVGADMKKLSEVIKTSAGTSWAFETKADNILVDKFEPGFRLWLQHKDLALARKMASDDGVPCPLLTLVHEMFESSKSMGLEDLDHSAVVKFYEKISNSKINT
jgi:3-hydroxyisobutyrate dehydrogenase